MEFADNAALEMLEEQVLSPSMIDYLLTLVDEGEADNTSMRQVE